MNEVHVIMDNVKKNKTNDDKPTNEISKIDATIKIIKEKSNGRFLLFSNYDQTFQGLIDKLNENKITFSKVMGSGPVVNKIIERFKSGEVKVLMLNALNYGSGLNLQMATDVIIYHQLSLELEVQVIGRAQRIGRNEPLNVYYLLHSNEKSNVSNPNLTLDLALDDDLNEFNKHLSQTTKKNIIVNLDDNVELNTMIGESTNVIKKKRRTKAEILAANEPIRRRKPRQIS